MTQSEASDAVFLARLAEQSLGFRVIDLSSGDKTKGYMIEKREAGSDGQMFVKQCRPATRAEFKMFCLLCTPQSQWSK